MRPNSDASLGGAERGDRPQAATAIAEHLEAALDDAETHESRFHIRQALQFVEALPE
ncbi:MAG: hypothetical protein ABEJ82_00200 [Haloplanus sp.]